MSTPQTKATAVHISCTALAPSVLGETEPIIIYNKVTTPVTLYTWKKFGTSSVGAGLTDTYTDGVTTHIGLAFNKTTAVLPGGASITTAAGDVILMRSLGSGNWRCANYAKAGTASPFRRRVFPPRPKRPRASPNWRRRPRRMPGPMTNAS